MTTLTGIIQYKNFAEETKSESSRPYIVLENGSQILLYKKNDNPFENTGFSGYEGQKVSVEGELENGTFVVENITQHFTENPKVSESSFVSNAEEIANNFDKTEYKGEDTSFYKNAFVKKIICILVWF